MSNSELSWNWQVEGNCDEPNPDIEKFHLRKIDLGDWKHKIQIKYGTSGLPYFRGYIICNQLEVAIAQLSKFEGFKVYQNKYGDKNFSFLIHQLNFLESNGLFVFYQKREWTEEDWLELIDNLSWILPDQVKDSIIEKLQNNSPTH
ncbi:MAG: hypothetical protein AB8F94_15685 [Saprospiraceae bacterium]